MTVEAKGIRVDLARAVWRKSSRSGPWTDNCVEVAFAADGVAVRDSKDPTGGVLVFTAAEWDAFVAGAKDGEFDRLSARSAAGERPSWLRRAGEFDR